MEDTLLVVAFWFGSFYDTRSTANIVAIEVHQFQKDRVEHARCEFERGLSMYVRIAGYN